ncbi:MAG: sugar phosphate isomerase/epimerase [Anaerolineae bacterium]|nr:sugar phosphate isomerase/epimerase [Anaerolineae bacterium]
MRLGFSSYAYRYAVADEDRPMDAMAMLRRAADLGADVVQYCDNLPLAHLTSTELAELRAAGEELGVALEVGTGGLDLASIARYLEIGVRLDSRALRLVPYSADAEHLETQLQALRPAVRESGLTLAVENRFGLRSAQLAQIVAALDDPALGFCVDTANSVGFLENSIETVTNLASRALQVHLKDYVVVKIPVGYQITGRPLGQGWLDIPAVLRALGPRRATLDYLIEFWMDPPKGRSETLAQEDHWVAQCLDAARRYLDPGADLP